MAEITLDSIRYIHYIRMIIMRMFRLSVFVVLFCLCIIFLESCRHVDDEKPFFETTYYTTTPPEVLPLTIRLKKKALRRIIANEEEGVENLSNLYEEIKSIQDVAKEYALHAAGRSIYDSIIPIKIGDVYYDESNGVILEIANLFYDADVYTIYMEYNGSVYEVGIVEEK